MAADVAGSAFAFRIFSIFITIMGPFTPNSSPSNGIMYMVDAYASSECKVTEFGSNRKFAQYTFDVGQPGSLKAHVSGKDPMMNSVHWWKGHLIYSQDSMILKNFGKNFTLVSDNKTGLNELVFRNNLTCGDAGIYRCRCGDSHFEVAVFVNGCCNQGTMTVDKERSTGLPGLINATSESTTREVHQIDFDAGSVYPDVSSLYASWTCNMCKDKAGEPASWEVTVPVTTRPDLEKKFNGVYTVFNYKGVTACFDIIAEGSSQNMTRTGCIAINASSYDRCWLRVSYNACNVTIVNYSKDCPILSTSVIPIVIGVVVLLLVILVAVGVGYYLWRKHQKRKRRQHENLKRTESVNGEDRSETDHMVKNMLLVETQSMTKNRE